MTVQNLHPADQESFNRLCESNPAWVGMVTAEQAIDLPQTTLLHAGPPFASVGSVTQPILNSACIAAVFEGLAADFDEAETKIFAGDILLKPAQDFGVVTPLAAVVSSTMPLHHITDLNRPQIQAYAPINGGSRPAMRLGIRSKDVLDHIRWLNGPFASWIASGLQQPIELIPLAVAALKQGDDCHGYTPEGGRLMMSELEKNISDGIGDTDTRKFIESSPSLFLNLWMAASKCMMMSASGVLESSFITAIAGNGLETGIQIAALPGRWFQTSAQPPSGRFDVDLPESRALPAIGDSAVVEGLGLGAMAIHLSPVQQNNLGEFLPADYSSVKENLLTGIHPGFSDLDCQLGLTARAADQLNRGPVIGLGILDKNGEKGRLGGGIYRMPVDVFKQAVQVLAG